MEFLTLLWHTFRDLSPETMNQLATAMGSSLYVLLFCIIFAETGLVVTPFLPGDSLLFAVGAVAAAPGSPISLPLTIGLLISAAVIGDNLNYFIGRQVGPRVFSRETKLFNKKHLVRAQEFYDRHGGKTIILARFVPIVRTFSPFVAGIGQMKYPRFLAYSVSGGAFWVSLFLIAGWKFGTQPVVQRNFHMVIVAIIVISLLPPMVEVARAWWAARRSTAAALEPVVSPESAGD